MEDLNHSIQQEHYERCASLRDILKQIDAWTEKQHVVLDPDYNGVIIRITSLQNFWAIILIRIVEGKMTDIIRDKKPKDDRSFNQMKASLEADL